MESVNSNGLNERLDALKRGEIVVCTLMDNVWKEVKYSLLQKESMISLFRTLVDTHKDVDRDDTLMSKFLDEYKKVFIIHEVLCERVLKETVGDELYIKIRDMRLKWEIDTDLNILKISR